MENNIDNRPVEKLDKSNFIKIGFSLGISIIVILLIQLSIGYIAGSRNPDFFKSPYYMWINMGVLYLIGVPILYLIVKNIPISKGEETTDYSFAQLFGFFAVCVSAMYLFNIVGVLFNLLISQVTGIPVVNPLDTVLSNISPVFILVVIVIIAPIVEEIIFRKIILDRVRIYGDKFAIIFTAFAFGLFHGNFSQFFYAFALGIIFAYVALRTNSIKYPIIFHIIINFMGSFASMELMKIAADLSAGEVLTQSKMILFGILTIMFLIFIILFFAGFAIFFMNIKKIKLEPKKVDASDREINKAAYLNIGFILFLIVSIVQFTMVILGGLNQA